MTARAHVTLRLVAVAWIGAMALLPRPGASSPKPAAATPAVVTPAAKHARVLPPPSVLPALATR